MSVWDEDALKDAFREHGIRPRHYTKVMVKLYEDFTTGKITHLDQFTCPNDVSLGVLKVFRSGKFALMTSKVIRREDSSDKTTTKLLVELQDGKEVEAVIMRYNNTATGGHSRSTLCVSSQVGCAMSCSFCSTGTMGLSGDLCSGEILEQFVWANQIDQIRNVVFMGMGEPLSSVYSAVLTSIRALTNGERFALKQSRVTVSTVGVVPAMLNLIEQAPFVTIALSLHAPTQAMREQIVPSARSYHLTELMDVIDHYHAVTGKQMLLEYVMLDDVNCSEETAHLLGKLLHRREVLLNLIPFNPVLTKAQHRAPSPDTVDRFANIVAQEYGIFVTARKEFGQDINGACGQLAVKARRKRRSEHVEALVNTAYEEPEEDDDVLGNGLEGIVSAMGALGGRVEAAACGSGEGESSAPSPVVDLEDLTGDKPKAKPAAKPKAKPQHQGGCGEDCDCAPQPKAECVKSDCPPGCRCHEFDSAIRAATEGVDPADVIAYSRAVLSTGPILSHGPRRPRQGVTRKQLLEEAEAARATGDDVPPAAVSVASDLVLPPSEKDLRKRVYMPNKQAVVAELSGPLMITPDDEFGRSAITEEKLAEKQKGEQLVPTSVAARQQEKKDSEPKATVEDGEYEDERIAKANTAEELPIYGNGKSRFSTVQRSTLDTKKDQKNWMAIITALVLAFSGVLALYLRQ